MLDSDFCAPQPTSTHTHAWAPADEAGRSESDQDPTDRRGGCRELAEAHTHACPFDWVSPARIGAGIA